MLIYGNVDDQFQDFRFEILTLEMKVNIIFIFYMVLVSAEKILTQEESIQRHNQVMSSKF